MAKMQTFGSAIFTHATVTLQCRQFSSAEPINIDTIKQRVLLVLNLYDKIDNNKVKMFIC
jgi:hypothetical protein